MTDRECFQKHWVGMLWLHRFLKFFDLLEVHEYNWEVVGSYILILDMVLYTCWWGLFYCLLRVFEIPGHCEDSAYVSYLRYSGIVRTMSTYLIWDTPVLYGQCLRIFLEFWVFDLEVYFVVCASVAYSWRLVIAVIELPKRYDCLWLDIGWEAEQIFWVCRRLRHCEDSAYVSYRILLPDIWSGELRCDLCLYDLLRMFGYCGERTTVALWLRMTEYWLRSRAEHSALHDGLELWEDFSVWRTVLEMEHEVPCCSVLQEGFVKEFDWIISFLNSRVTSLDVW